MIQETGTGLREPPEGVLTGDTVPQENDRQQLEEGLVDELAALMKVKPGYSDLTEGERREIAHDKLAELGN